jgi:LPXTG-motif cell wall-anchored protein
MSIAKSNNNSALIAAGGLGLIAAIGAMVFMKSKK